MRQENEEHFRLIVENVKDYAIFTLDPHGFVDSWNVGAENIKGYRPDEILGKHYSIFYPPEDRAAGKPDAILKEVALAGRHEMEGWRIRKDGTRFWANIVVTALRDEAGTLKGFAKIVRDMTQRKKADEALRRQVIFLNLLQEVAVAANQAAQVDEAIQYALDRICHYTGWPVGHAYTRASQESNLLVSTHLWSLASERFREFQDASEALQFDSTTGLPGAVLQHGEPFWQTHLIEDEGFLRVGAASACGLKTGVAFPIMVGKHVMGVLEFFMDQTLEPDLELMELMAHIGTQLGRVIERSQSEEALRLSEARFRTIFTGSPLGIELVDLDGQVLASNPAIGEMLGYNLEASEALNTKSEVNLVTQAGLVELLKSGKQEDLHLERTFQRENGQTIWGRLSIAQVGEENDHPRLVVAMLEDITEQKQMEGELVELRRRLTEGREAERLHLAQELHDGPMQDLYGLAYHLKAYRSELPSGLNDRPLEEVQGGLQQVVRALRTVCGELRPPSLAPFGLEKAIRSHAESFRAAHPELRLHLYLEPDGQTLPEAVRLAFFRIYQQALANVIRHAAAKNVDVYFTLSDQEAQLEISDDGKGFVLPERWIELVREGHLGLAGAAERVEAIGGRLEVRSKPEMGTRLGVIFPRLKNGTDAISNMEFGGSNYVTNQRTLSGRSSGSAGRDPEFIRESP